MLWVDKYRPKSLDKVTVNADVALQLKQLVAGGDCPHLLFFGPSGAGKKTLIMALLKEMFGSTAEKVKVENKAWKIETGGRNVEVELTTISSNCHVEMTPADANFQDRLVVQEIIKDMAKSRPLDSKSFKVLVLNEVDRMSREAQHSLRRTMEKYSAACRLVMWAQSPSRVSEALRSRCLNLRIGAPSQAQIIGVLQDVSEKEGIRLPAALSGKIALLSNRNLRKAILSLQACHASQYPFVENQAVETTDWEAYISDIANDIITEQSPRRLLQIRGKLYDLLVNCIPAEVIFKKLVTELMKKLDAELKHDVAHWAAFYEHRLQQGQKPIFHLEAFVAKFMSIYKQFLVATFG